MQKPPTCDDHKSGKTKQAVNRLNPVRLTHLQKCDDQICGMSCSPQTTPGPLSIHIASATPTEASAFTLCANVLCTIHPNHSQPRHRRYSLVPFAFNGLALLGLPTDPFDTGFTNLLYRRSVWAGSPVAPNDATTRGTLVGALSRHLGAGCKREK